MADADAALKLLIELGLVGQEKADEAKKALDQLKEDSKDVGTETSKMGGAMLDTAASEENLNISHREMHMLLQSLGAEHVPGLSQALMALHSGPMLLTIGGFIALASAVKNVVAAIQEVHAETIKAADASAEIDIESWKEMKQNLVESADAAHKFADGLERIRDVNEELKTQSEFVKAVADEQAKAAQELIKAQEAAALKKLEQDKEAERARREAVHMTGGEQEFEARYKAQEEAVRQKFRDAGRQAGFQAEEGGIAREEAGLSIRVGQGQQLDKAARDAEAAYENLKSQDISGLTSARKLFSGQADEADKKLKEARYTSDFNETSPEVVKARTAVENLHGIVDEFDKEIKEHTDAVAKAKKSVEEAVTARDANTKAMQTETDLLDQHIAVLRTRLAGSQAVATAEGDSGLVALLTKILNRLDADKTQFDALAKRVDHGGT